MRRFLDLFRISAGEWWHDNTFRMAAALAFYTVFSLSPLLVISIAIAGAVFDREQARRQVVSEIELLAGPEGGAAVRTVSEQAELVEGSPLAVTIGVLTLVLGSTVVFAELQSDLNHIWDVQADPRRHGMFRVLRGRVLSFALALGVAFLLLVSLLISAALAAMREQLTHSTPQWGWIWQAASTATSLVIVAVLFAAIYKVLPDVKTGWRDVLVGAVVTSLLFSLGKLLIGLYLGQMAIGSTYGAAGSLVVFLIWIYYSALICFLGAEFTQVYARRYGSGIRPQPHAVRVGNKSDTV